MPSIAGFLITAFANADRIVGFNDPKLGGLPCHEAELIINTDGTTGDLFIKGGQALMKFKPKIGYPQAVYLIRKLLDTERAWEAAAHGEHFKCRIQLCLVYVDPPIHVHREEP